MVADDAEPVSGSALSSLAPLSFSTLTLWRALHTFGTDMLSELGLYPGQELILLQLYEQDAQTQTDLQRAVRLDHSTVSRTIRRMEQAGLVARRPAENDKRAMVVSLTAHGRALRPDVLALWTTVENAITEVLTDGERADFTELTGRLERSLTAARERRRRGAP